MKRCWSAFTAVLCLLTSFAAHSFNAPGMTTVTGVIQRVIDGDTVIMRTAAGANIVVRLAGIDAPELTMPHGQDSRRALRDLVADRALVIQLHKRDRYGRWVGVLWLDATDVNLQMVSLGWAWHYRRYAAQQQGEDALRYVNAEFAARHARSGLWGDDAPTPPWAWRQQCRAPSVQPPPDLCHLPPSMAVKAS
jgi:endonuclease YncB( thermonuclease family)